MKHLLAIVLPACCVIMFNCAMLNSLHTAKTLGPGVATLSIAMDGAAVNTATGVSDEPLETAPADSVTTTPNASILPNLQFQMGISENVEIGAFFVPLMLGVEASVKYRFYHDDANHLAIIPTASYFCLSSYSGGTHLVYTRDLSQSVSLSCGAFGSYSYYNEDLFSNGFFSTPLIQKHYINIGGYIAPTISGESVYFIPSFEYSSFLPLTEGILQNRQCFRGRITIGWYIGKVKMQLDRIEGKIDRINEKLDNNQ